MDPNSNKCSLTKEQHLEYKPMTSIATLMESFRRTYSLGDNCELNYYGDIKNCSNLAELLIKDEKNRVVNNNTDPKTNGVGWCFSYNKNNKCNFCRTRDITQNIVNCNYLPDIICEHCKDKLRKLKSDPATQIKVKNTYKLRGTKSLYSTHPPMPPISIRDEINTKATNGERIADANISPELGFGSVVQFEDDELKLYWLEVRNSIFQIFHEEGITLNSVTRKYLNPPIFNSFVLQSTDMLKDCVHKLFTSNRRKLFTLCVFQLQLFIIEIKLRLHIELMENKPYYIFPFFYIAFERLLRALQRIDGFLGCVEDEYLKPNKLKWFNFHLLFFQTFVYMNRFIQQSISLLCDCTDDNDFKTYNDEDSKMTGRFILRSYITLDKTMASFSIFTNANSSNFQSLFSKFLDLQLLLQFAIQFFNCKNYEENVYSKRFFPGFTVQTLQDMEFLRKDMLINDAFKTIIFQLLLVIPNWDNSQMLDYMLKRLFLIEKPNRQCLKSILHKTLYRRGFKEEELLRDFYCLIGQEKSFSFDHLLTIEIVLNDEENFEAELFSSYCREKENGGPSSYFSTKYNVDCRCYNNYILEPNDYNYPFSYFPPNRNCEMRERLRKRLNKKKKQTNIPELESAEEDEKKSNIKDERNLDDLLQFINGDNGENEQLNDNKKKKKTRKRHPKNSAAATPTNDEKSPLKESKSPTNDNNKSSKKRKNKKMKHKDRNFPVVSNTKKKSNENVLNHEMIDVDQCSESIDANDEDDGEVDEVNHLVNQFDLADNSQESDCDNVIFEESKSFNIAENEDDDEFEYEEDYYNDDVELVEYSDEDVEEPVEYDNIYSKHKDQILEWPNDSLMVIDDVFKPKDIDLENEDMDEFERQLELFKRLCYDPFSTNKSVKPKLIIDVNEVFKRI